MRFGIELEVVGMDPSEAAALITSNGIACNSPSIRHSTQATWKCVSDGSVSNGFELVSPPMIFGETAFDVIRDICRILQDAGCSVNSSCGFHVHFEIANLPAQHVANIFNRYRKFQDDINKFLAPSRRNNRYCQRAASDLRPADSIQGLVSQQISRYAAVNLQSFVKYGTIEFRQHQGTVNASKVISWVKFLAQFIEASAAPVETVVEAPAPVVAPTAATSGVAVGDYIAMPANSRRIIDLLTGRVRMTAEELASNLNMTPDSVRSSISRLRTKYNVRINFRRGAYGLLSASRPEVNAPVAAPRILRQDKLFDGCTESIQTYYARRATCIAAGA